MRALISLHSVTIAAVLAAGTALPLILAVPLGSMPRGSGELTAAPMEFTPAERVSTQAAPVAAEPASELPTASAEHTTAVQRAAGPDPLGSLDPTDRAIAENIRDLLATKPDQFFASKKDRAAK